MDAVGWVFVGCAVGVFLLTAGLSLYEIWPERKPSKLDALWQAWHAGDVTGTDQYARLRIAKAEHELAKVDARLIRLEEQFKPTPRECPPTLADRLAALEAKKGKK